MRAVLLLLLLVLVLVLLANSRSQWALPDFICQQQIAVGTAGLHLPATDRSGHCRTSCASSRSQWALPDFICQQQIAVGTAGLQPPAPYRSGHCPDFTINRSQWALPGLHAPAADRSGHCRSSSASNRLQWALPDFSRQLQIAVGLTARHSLAHPKLHSLAHPHSLTHPGRKFHSLAHATSSFLLEIAGGVGWGGVGWDNNAHVPARHSNLIIYLSCSCADTGTPDTGTAFSSSAGGGVGWGGTTTFMFLRAHRHSNLIIFPAFVQTQALQTQALLFDAGDDANADAGFGAVDVRSQ
eukprot:s590_g48.t1